MPEPNLPININYDIVRGRPVTKHSKFYWAKYGDNQGKLQRHALKLPNGSRVTDKDVANALLDQILKRLEREATGLIDHAVEPAGLPIRAVFAKYVGEMRNTKRAARGHIKQAVAFFKWIVDKAEMTRLADFNRDNIVRALSALSMAGSGESRQTRGKGCSPKTVNEYRGACYSFGEWCIKQKLFDANPVGKIPHWDVSDDTRKERRSLTAQQAYRLLDVSGPRRLRYTLHLWTGLRISQGAGLEWRDLDLERASIPEVDDNGRTVDLHALKKTFVTWLVANDVGETAKVRLAQHSPKGVTERHYLDFKVIDLWREIAKLRPCRPPRET